MSIYIPNVGEIESLKSILTLAALEVGLYKNVVSPDGGTTFLNIQEMPSGGGRGYARKSLANEIVESGLAANKWYLHQNQDGKAEAQYHNVALEWEFNSVDVADGNTVYGFFGITRVVPFDQGSVEIKPGDMIAGATSDAYATVVGVIVTSGSWGSGTAAGYLFIKEQGTELFQDDENLIIKGKIDTVAVNAGGSSYAVGDILGVTQTGGLGAKLVVTTVDTGAVTGVVVVEGGQGYSVATGLATTAITGTGTGCTIDISTLSTAARAVSNTGTLFGGDSHKQLMILEAFTESKLIDTNGQKIKVTLKLTQSTA